MAIYIGLIAVIVVILLLLIIQRSRQADADSGRIGGGISTNSKRLIVASVALACAVGALALSLINPPS